MRLFLLSLLCSLSLGCAQYASEAVDMARTAATFVSTSDPILRGMYESEQRACLTSNDAAKRDACVADVRKRWQPIRDGLTDIRAAWCKFEPEKCQAQDAKHNE